MKKLIIVVLILFIISNIYANDKEVSDTFYKVKRSLNTNNYSLLQPLLLKTNEAQRLVNQKLPSKNMFEKAAQKWFKKATGYLKINYTIKEIKIIDVIFVPKGIKAKKEIVGINAYIIFKNNKTSEKRKLMLFYILFDGKWKINFVK